MRHTTIAKKNYSLIFFVLLLTQFNITFSQTSIENDFKPIFDKYGVDGCFAMYNESKNEYIRYNAALCDTGYIPASTFKIPHSVIALEEGVVKDTTQVFKWDGHVWPNKPWNQDQTLATAIKYSCIWVYFGFAEKIGIAKYYQYVKAFNYGNMDLTGPPTRFWLAGSFRISANQQIDFLRKFYNYELPVSKRSIDIVKKIIVLDKTDKWTLSGKTGGGRLVEGENIMWLVGYLERGNNVYYYALNFKTTDFNKTAKARYGIAKDIFKELHLME